MKGPLFFYESLLRKRISRKEFIKLCLSCVAFLSSSNIFTKLAIAKEATSRGRKKKGIKGKYDLVIAKGEDPYLMTFKAVQSIGGMDKFVKKNTTVVIKPNIAWDRSPEQAANTNPQVVACLVELCYQAGAKRVNVFDIPCNDARRCYLNSGIQKAAKEKGARVYFADQWNMAKAKFNYRSLMDGWPILRDALECDTFINVPVLKHHSLTGLTLSMKNLMGVCGGNRARIHNDIGRKLVDLADFINPELTVVDAFRVLVRNGPSGGNLNDVISMKTIIVGQDPTLVDSYASRLAGVDPLSIPYINEANKRHFGIIDIDSANMLTLNV